MKEPHKNVFPMVFLEQKSSGSPRMIPSWPPNRTARDVLLDSGEFGPYVRELLAIVDTDPPLLQTCNIKSHHLHGQKLG